MKKRYFSAGYGRITKRYFQSGNCKLKHEEKRIKRESKIKVNSMKGEY